MRRALVGLAIVCLILALGWEAGGRPTRTSRPARESRENRLAVVPEARREAPPPDSTSYSVSNLVPGDYVVVATAKGYGSLLSGPVIVPNGDRVVEHDLVLPAPVELEVLVVDAAGKGQPRAEVDVVDATWGLPVPVETKNGPTDHLGRLTLIGLGPGRYRLRAILPAWTGEETLVEVVGSSPPTAPVRVRPEGR